MAAELNGHAVNAVEADLDWNRRTWLAQRSSAGKAINDECARWDSLATIAETFEQRKRAYRELTITKFAHARRAAMLVASAVSLVPISAHVAFAQTMPAQVAADATPTPSSDQPEDPAMTKLAASLFDMAQKGAIDKSLFDPALQDGLNADALAHLKARYGPIGPPDRVALVGFDSAPGFRSFRYRILWKSGAMDEVFALDDKHLIIAWYFTPPGRLKLQSPDAASPAASPT